MKKIITIVISLLILIPSVKADTSQIEVGSQTFEDFYQIEITQGNEQIKLYDYFMNIFNNQNDYEYYTIDFYNYNNTYFYNVHFSMYNTFDYTINNELEQIIITSQKERTMYGWNVTDGLYGPFTNQTGAGDLEVRIRDGLYGYLDSNVNIINQSNNYEIEGLYNSIIKINIGDRIPTLKDLSNSSIREDYILGQGNFREINLDNYDYVLLTLKNYNNKNPFQTNLSVKGQIGITPIYNYGQTSKDSITGVKVQDRCNANYENYTTYPLYILQNDLQNNVVYAIKECSQNSKFKYDSNIFDIFYVTAENRADPTVTINGQTYHTIPYSDLPSTATQNEEENYIPGQSGNITDSGGLDGAIKGIQQKMSEIWNTFTYFTSFVNQLFSVLPQELRIILISAFTISIILGLIKIFIN